MPAVIPDDDSRGASAVEVSRAGLRALGIGLAVVSAVTLVLAVTVLVLNVWHGVHLNHNAGSTAALAHDAVQGEFYRPIDDGVRYGGTRVMPGFVLLHALVHAFDQDPVRSGLIAGCLGFLLWAAAFLLCVRRFVADRIAALSAVALALAALPILEGVGTTRSDVLSHGFALLGLAICARKQPLTGWQQIAAGAAFAAGWYARFVTVAAAAAVILVRFRQGDRATALRIAAATTLIAAGLVVAMELASGQRFIGQLLECGGGGSRLRSLFGGPIGLRHLVQEDPGLTVTFLLIGTGLLSGAVIGRRGLLWWFTLFAFVVFLGIGGSPGVSRNHLLECICAGILLAARSTSRSAPAARAGWLGLTICVQTITIGMMIGWIANARSPRENCLSEFARTVAAIPAAPGLILSDHPFIPLAAGESPAVLDAYMVLVLQDRRPELIGRLVREVEQGAYRAVVLVHDPETPAGQKLYRESYFGRGFVQALLRRYHRKPDVGRYFVYLP